MPHTACKEKEKEEPHTATKEKETEEPYMAIKEKEKQVKEKKRQDAQKKQNEKRKRQDYEMAKVINVFDFDNVGTNRPSLNSNGLWEEGGAVAVWKRELENFGFADVGKGLVPAAVQKILEACGLRKGVARNTVLVAWKEAGVEVKAMWKLRCEITVAWDEEHGIRQAAKGRTGRDMQSSQMQQGRSNADEGMSGPSQAHQTPTHHNQKKAKSTKHRRINASNTATTIPYATCPLCHGPTPDRPHESWEHTPEYLARNCAASIWTADRLGIHKIPPGYTTIDTKYIASYTLQSKMAPVDKHANSNNTHPRTDNQRPLTGKCKRPTKKSVTPLTTTTNKKHNQHRNIFVPYTDSEGDSMYHSVSSRQRQRQSHRTLESRTTTSTHTPSLGVQDGRSFFVNNFSSDPSPLG